MSAFFFLEILEKFMSKKMLLSIIATVLFVGALTGCTEADRAQLNGYGGTFKITLYAASGSEIKSWVSEGKVHTEAGSDGYYFNDTSTNKLVRVTGTIIVEQVK
jgi:uncharacterized protein YdeI (BOF family)